MKGATCGMHNTVRWGANYEPCDRGPLALVITGTDKADIDSRRSLTPRGAVRSLAALASLGVRWLWNGRGTRASRASGVIAISFHLTSDCEHQCPYCWAPKGFLVPIDTATALRIVSRVKEVGARRIIFTGGDPLARSDIRLLVLYARDLGLETALSTSGERLTLAFLNSVGSSIDLVYLPLDGSCEAVNARTRNGGHFVAVMEALARLRDRPEIDVKICTAVTRHNIEDVPRILRLVEDYAETTNARIFYDVAQVFPRAMFAAEWDELLVSNKEFAVLHDRLSEASVPVNFLDHGALDRSHVAVLPDGRLVIPCGDRYPTYGEFLELSDLDEILRRGRFDVEEHRRQFELGQAELQRA